MEDFQPDIAPVGAWTLELATSRATRLHVPCRRNERRCRRLYSSVASLGSETPFRLQTYFNSNIRLEAEKSPACMRYR